MSRYDPTREELTPNWHVVNHHHHGSGTTECEDGSCENASLGDDSSGDSRYLGHEKLNGNEGYHQNSKKNEQSDNTPVVPCVH